LERVMVKKKAEKKAKKKIAKKKAVLLGQK
jgi:hypothetical protein